VRGTHTGPLQDIAPTGRSVALPGCNVIELRDGLIYREADYFDTATMLKQLGVTEG
jgi:predicted ester cyclase